MGPIARAARTIAITAVAGVLVLPAAAPAALDIHHDSTSVSDLGGGDGIVSPGDSLAVTETVFSAEPGADLTGITGTLSTSTPLVTVPQPNSSYPTLSFAGTASNTTPFGVQLDSGLECGQTAKFSLALNANQGSATVPFTIGTGIAAAPSTTDSTDVPHGIPDVSQLTSTLPISRFGRVKDIAVHIGKITHSYDGDLQITLIAPDGTRSLLVDQRGGASDNFVNTTITPDQGASLNSAVGPFTGTYIADGDLSKMIGVQEQGTWKLEIKDLSSGNVGTLVSWGIEISEASCAAQPVANFTATPNPALPGDTVQFDASGSHDPVGTINHYEWDLDGDGTFETDTGTSPFASHLYAARGAYPVSVRVTDDGAKQNVYTRSVHVSNPPTAAVTASPLAPLSGQSVTLDAGGSSDPDGPIARYEWDLDGDGTFETDTGTVSQLQHAFATPGVHTVGVQVTDSDGATDIATVDVSVTNRLPTAQIADPGLGIVGQPMTLDASGSSDPDGTVATYAWDLDNNGTYESSSGLLPSSPPVTFNTPGMKTVGVEVTDNDFGTAATTVTFKVTTAPNAVLNATPDPARPAQTVTFDAAGSNDPDGTPVTYKWDLNNDGTFETDSGSVASQTKSWSTPGNYTVKVKVTDGDSAWTVASRTVAVVNQLPVASVVVSGGEAIAGTPTTLDASGSTDPDGTVVHYQWDLDANGSFETDTGSTASVTRTYPNPATIPVKLRVTDNDGGVAVTTFSLVVKAPAPGGGGTGGTGGTGGNGGSGGSAGGTGGTAGGTGGTGGGGGTTPLGDFSAGLGGAPIQAIRLAARKGVTMTCTSDRAMSCNVTATIDGGTAKKLHLARVRKAAKVGTAAIDVPAGGDGRFVLKLSAKVRKALKRAKRVRLLIKGTAVDADGHQYALARTILLR
jgi:subtilisin-like proprotein convertase family protein